MRSFSCKATVQISGYLSNGLQVYEYCETFQQLELPASALVEFAGTLTTCLLQSGGPSPPDVDSWQMLGYFLSVTLLSLQVSESYKVPVSSC